MDQRWIKDLNKELESELRQNYKESLVMRKRLIKILEDEVSKSNAKARSEISYDNPNWSLLQADQRGFERALVKIIDLISK